MGNCSACQQEISSEASVCPHCGQPAPLEPLGSVSPKRRGITMVLAWLLGVFGAHRFYVGKTGTAILQILTLGGLGIWVLVDLVMLLCGKFKDKQGRRLLVW